ncbi:MAG: hypothetical protein HY954_11225 [Deltaproteobacteria bacterium]|nr:hypothetical protein [Deltaproteobacteria bacterium]
MNTTSLLRSMSRKDLTEIAISALLELQARHQMEKEEGIPIEFVQSRESLLCTADGVPIDRPEWFHIPFLREYSKAFQPSRTTKGNRYRAFFKEGQKLMVRGSSHPVVMKVGGAVKVMRDADGSLLLKGPFSIL